MPVADMLMRACHRVRDRGDFLVEVKPTVTEIHRLSEFSKCVHLNRPQLLKL